MLAIGSVWGSVRLKGIESEPIMELGPHGKPYPSGEFGPRVYVIECKCGREKRIPVHEFPGKWNFRYCGEADCEYSPEALKAKRQAQARVSRGKVGRPPSDDPCANVTVSLPISLLQRIKEHASGRNLSLSRAAADLTNKGLTWELEHAGD